MRFGVLGPLEVARLDGSVPLGGPKQRTVLAHLIVNANRVVPADRLIDALWGDEPPEAARGTLQAYVSRLRSALGTDVIEGSAPGYVLHADAEDVDSVRFERILHDARQGTADPRAMATALDEALALWRGPAFADLAGEPSLAGEIARLEELRLQAVEEKLAAELDLGRHAEAIAELETLTRAHPLRERLWGELMLALYRDGRQADALEAFARARQQLAEELGIDPSRELQELHERILRQDAALDLLGEPLRGYRLLEQVGEGAFGLVFRAIQPQVGREVAIKAVHPELANHPDFVRRFEREAQIVARLEHPHIVPLYDYWREPDAAYLVMRFLRGGSLEDLVDRGPMEPARAVAILTQVASALAAAHRQGVVHRDVKPGNVLLDEEGNAYLTDFGVALDAGSPEQTTGTMMRGTPAYLSPEQIRLEPATPRADVYALGIVAFEMLTGQHPFPDGSLTSLLDRHLRDPLPSVRETRPELPRAADAAIARATAKDALDRFEDVLELATALRASFEGTAAPAGVPVEVRNPYKGLRAFLEADAGDFFGREVLTDRLVRRLAEPEAGARFLAVVGPSGSGKSSVVRAGLVPALRRGSLPGSERWYVIEVLPGASPLRELESALLGVAVEPPPSLMEELERDELGLVRAVDRILPASDAELVIVLDQLEEVFTLTRDERERNHLLASLRAAVLEPESRVRIVTTLRADFYDQPLAVRGFGDLLAARNEAVTPMSPEELERAIAAPADRAGLIVDPQLLAVIVADVVDEPGALPLLQYALTELAERADDGVLRLEAYRRIGGVSGALARRAEQLFEELDEGGRVACRQLFLRLVTLGKGSEDTRRRVRRAELDALADAETMEGVIGAFGRHRLLSFDRDPDSREPTVEIAHEALLRAWSRLAGWVDEARADIRAERQVAAAAAEWEASGRDPSFLLRGVRLEQIASWAGATSVALSPLDESYVDASVARREEEVAAESARAERERLLQRRSLRRARALVAVLTTAVVVAGTLTAIASSQRGRAEQEARLADAQRLAAESVANLETNPDLSILLAIEAVEATRRIDGTVLPVAEQALHRAVQASRVVLSTPGHFGVAFHPHRDLLATAQTDGRIEILDARSGDEVATLRGHTARVNGVAFSADGDLLVAASEDRTVSFWNTATWTRVGGIDDLGGTPLSPALSPDGSEVIFSFLEVQWVSRPGAPGTGLVLDEVPPTRNEVRLPGGPGVAMSEDGALFAGAGGRDGPAVVWDRRTHERVWTFGSAVIDVAFSPDGKLFATAEDDAAARLWSLETGRLVGILLGHTSSVEAVDFSPDGSLLASASLDGTVRIWDIGSGRTQLVLSGQGAAIENVDFDRHGMRVVGGSSGGTVLVWDITPEASREVLTIPVPGAFRLAVSPDGHTLLTGGFDGAAHLLDAQTGEEIRTLTGHAGSVLHATYDPSGSRIATAGADGTVRIWDAATGEEVRTLQHTSQAVGAPVSSVAFGPDGAQLVSVGIGATKVWDVRTGQVIHTLFGHAVDRMVFDVAFAPSGDLIATSAQDETVRVWDATTGEQLWTGRHTNNVIGVAFSPRGGLVATGSLDGTVRIWRARTGDEVRVLRGHSGGVNGVAFSPDGSLLATASEDRTTRIWDVGTGRGVLTLFGHEGTVFTPAFFPDGRRLATVAEDGTIRISTLEIDELLDLARARLTRGFTLQECRQYEIEPCPATA